MLICIIGTWKDVTKYQMPWEIYSKRWFQWTCRTDILIHAVSCGEAMAMIPVMAYLTKYQKNIKYTLSVHTYTGYTLIKQNVPNRDNIVLKPFDTLFTMFLFFLQLWPKCIIISESDTCPCFLIIAKLFRIPIFYMNYKYKPEKPIRNLLHRCIADHIYTQNNITYNNNYSFVGNLKFLAVNKDTTIKKPIPLTIIIASAGKDEIEIHLNYIRAFSNNVRFIYVPRHLSWDVRPYFDKLNRPYSVITTLASFDSSSSSIVICSAIGMLDALYKKSHICLMGDTFNKIGGHNLIEPAITQNAIILGPNFHTCKEMADMLNITYALSETDLINKTLDLLENNTYSPIGKENQLLIYTYRKTIKKAFKQAMTEIIFTLNI